MPVPEFERPPLAESLIMPAPIAQTWQRDPESAIKIQFVRQDLECGRTPIFAFSFVSALNDFGKYGIGHIFYIRRNIFI